jgi:hypothetical protein
VDWTGRFIRFHGRRYPRDMGASEIEAFLTHLVVEKHVSSSPQNQAFGLTCRGDTPEVTRILGRAEQSISLAAAGASAPILCPLSLDGRELR